MTKIFRAIGLMSGTSMDGIDLALIESDGKTEITRKYFDYLEYEHEFKVKLRNIICRKNTALEIAEIENELTNLHAQLVNDFLAKNNIDPESIDLIGFHGHTIAHNPEQKITWQIGNKYLLEKLTNIRVIHNFRKKDVANGGQGAPLVPIFHYHLFEANKAKIIVNIGGISNLTYFNEDGIDSLEAFDYCFGNAPMDDLVKNIDMDYDEDGKLAKKGKIDYDLANKTLENNIFKLKPPKSFDRDEFDGVLVAIKKLKIEDALATLCYIHSHSLKMNISYFAKKPQEIILCGGGRKNQFLVEILKQEITDIDVLTAEDVGLNGDSVEAEAFAYLGIRKAQNLPISFKKTTGIG